MHDRIPMYLNLELFGHHHAGTHLLDNSAEVYYSNFSTYPQHREARRCALENFTLESFALENSALKKRKLWRFIEEPVLIKSKYIWEDPYLVGLSIDFK